MRKTLAVIFATLLTIATPLPITQHRDSPRGLVIDTVIGVRG